MFVKIDPSGTCERRGLVQVRLCFYLEKSDHGYEKHHVTVPVIPEGGYKGTMSKDGHPDKVEFAAWVEGLPTVVQDNPFHNHFIQVHPATSDAEIMDMAEAYLHEAAVKWGQDLPLDLVNPPITSVLSPDRQEACDLRVKELKMLKAVRTI